MNDQPQNPLLPAPPAEESVHAASSLTRQDKLRLAGLVLLVFVIIAGLVVAAVFLFKAKPETTGQIRDVFIIFMALESLIIGVALVILVIQLAILTNLIQHEIKPILDATNETVNTLRGTTTFLSDNLVQPVIKLNEYLAGFRKILDLLRPGRR